MSPALAPRFLTPSPRNLLLHRPVRIIQDRADNRARVAAMASPEGSAMGGGEIAHIAAADAAAATPPTPVREALAAMQRAVRSGDMDEVSVVLCEAASILEFIGFLSCLFDSRSAFQTRS